MSKDEPEIKSNFLRGLMGGVASSIADLVTFPIDSTKTRLQMGGKQGIPEYRNTGHAVKHTFSTEGLKGFYRGLSANVCRQMTYSTIRVWIYNDVKKASRMIRNKIFTKQMSDDDDVTIFEKFLAGGLGGSIGIVFGNPFDVYKIRMINDIDVKKPKYSGLMDCMRKSYV